MSKTQLKQDTSSTFKLSERVILATCVVAFTVAFALMGVFFRLSWVFFLLLVADLAILVGGKLSDSSKRFALVVSAVGAIVALLFAATSHPWLFQ